MDNENINQLSELIVDKISENVKNNIDNLLNSAKLKRDNEILALQIEKLMTDNKNLAEKLELAENNITKFKQIYGLFYIKQP